jgi:hypothetical protein
MHTKKNLRDWFELEYKPALEYTQVRSSKYVHNMDEKGAQIACPAGEDVIVLDWNQGYIHLGALESAFAYT